MFEAIACGSELDATGVSDLEQHGNIVHDQDDGHVIPLAARNELGAGGPEIATGQKEKVEWSAGKAKDSLGKASVPRGQ